MCFKYCCLRSLGRREAVLQFLQLMYDKLLYCLKLIVLLLFLVNYTRTVNKNLSFFSLSVQ